MKRIFGVLLLAATLTACGVDGPPVPPPDEPETQTRGLTISGTVRTGIAGSF